MLFRSDDVAAELRELAADVDHDPAELARLEDRLSLIYGLERRYGEDEAAVVAHGEAALAEADRLRNLDVERSRRAAADAHVRARRRADAAALEGHGD